MPEHGSRPSPPPACPWPDGGGEERESFYRSLFDRNPCAVFSLDRSGRITRANGAALAFLGRTARSVCGADFCSLVLPGARERTREALRRAAGGDPQVLDLSLRREDGVAVELHATFGPVVIGGEVAGVFGVAEEVTGRRRAEAALRASEALFRRMVEGSDQGFFYLIDHQHRFLYVSPSVERVIGYSAEELLGKPFEELMVWEPSGERGPPQAVRVPTSPGPFTVTVSTPGGKEVVLELVEHPVRDGEAGAGFQGFAHDVTQQKEVERQLVHSALHDTLTGLPNRALFWDRLEQAVRLAERYPERIFAVLMVDLDRFKLINDTLGHPAGDQLLVEVARRLEGCVRPGDTVCRLGGDEFVLLIDDMRDVSDATRVASRIERGFEEPFRLEGEDVPASASIGIALGTGSDEDPDALVRNADRALYRAKALGSGRYEVYDREMRAGTQARLRLEDDLLRALEREEFRVEYQPVVSLESGRIWAFEALVRWQHPVRGLIPPSEFVPVAEDTGRIVAIDLWVLREACRKLRGWHDRFPGVPLQVSVNLSGKQLFHHELVGTIRRVLDETPLDARSLKLEVDERVLAAHAEASAGILQELKAMDVHLQVDHFGTGASSLCDLRRLPVDTLKIDRSLVVHDDGNTEIVRAAVRMAHTLELTVVAGGVETPEQLRRVRELECDYAQGFALSPPLGEGGAEALLAGEAAR